jgi:hypothetical protein
VGSGSRMASKQRAQANSSLRVCAESTVPGVLRALTGSSCVVSLATETIWGRDQKVTTSGWNVLPFIMNSPGDSNARTLRIRELYGCVRRRPTTGGAKPAL